MKELKWKKNKVEVWSVTAAVVEVVALLHAHTHTHTSIYMHTIHMHMHIERANEYGSNGVQRTCNMEFMWNMNQKLSVS